MTRILFRGVQLCLEEKSGQHLTCNTISHTSRRKGRRCSVRPLVGINGTCGSKFSPRPLIYQRSTWKKTKSPLAPPDRFLRSERSGRLCDFSRLDCTSFAVGSGSYGFLSSRVWCLCPSPYVMGVRVALRIPSFLLRRKRHGVFIPQRHINLYGTTLEWTSVILSSAERGCGYEKYCGPFLSPPLHRQQLCATSLSRS